ncbi:MAG TPA: M23 family metallopeptidase [Arthrobacter sp.]|nr:M23 family metallopeptidase [Arthrobacter sp.]
MPTRFGAPWWLRHCLTILAAALAVIAVSIHLTALPASGTDSTPQWKWPVDSSPDVLRAFDKPPEPWLSGHRGVDLEVSGGGEIRAPADGRISFAGWVVDRPVLTIEHPSGLRSSFESVETELSEGDAVSRGEVVGHVSTPWHCGSTPCLHWGVRRGGEYLNPLQFVTDMRPSVLLPLPPEALPPEGR